jgi:acyl-CoA thioester hydrolase
VRRQGAIAAAIEVTVPFHDVDLAGVVWHGHYMKYLENARWAVMERLGFGLEAMIASGFLWPIVSVEVKYVRVARYGERLRVLASLVEWETRLALNYTIVDCKDESRVGRAKTVQVAVDAVSHTMQWVSPPCLVDRVKATLEKIKNDK